MSGADDTGDTLARMLSAPFPATREGPLESCSFDACEQILSPSPRRLVHCVEVGYYDPQQAEPGQEPDAVRIELDYRERFRKAVAAAEEHFGPALNPHDDATLYQRLDEEFTNFDQQEIAIWPGGKRLAVLVFGWVFGDDDFEAVIAACVVPDDREA